jgi:hypothetical protein
MRFPCPQGGEIDSFAVPLHKVIANAKRAAEAALLGNWVPPSKENDHPAMSVVMMVVVLPPELLEVLLVMVVVVVMMMAVHAVGGRCADSAGERAGGDEDGDEA